MIRMARRGKKNKPFYRIIVSEKSKDTAADALEILGSVDPLSKPKAVTLNAERIAYWLGHGAAPSPSVRNLLEDKGVIIKQNTKNKK